MPTAHDPAEEAETLRAQLMAQVNDLARETRTNSGHVPPESFLNAQRLVQLAQWQRDLKRPRPLSRSAVAVLFVTTLGLASVLLLARVGETEVDLDLVVSELRFKLDSRQQLTEIQQLTSLAASGLASVTLPGASAAAGAADTGLRLAVASDGAAPGSISLAPIVAPARSEVLLRIGDSPGELRLSIKGLDATVRADVGGPISVALPRRPRQTIDAATPQAVELAPGPADFDLDLAPSNTAVAVLAPELTISELILMRIDEVSQGTQTVVRRVSTIQSGSAYFDELGGRELRLRAHDSLRFASARGEIRSLRVSNGSLAVNFHGRVSGMASGPLQHPRDLMPRWLEWLSANRPLSLLWGAAIYLFGLLTAVRQWWTKSD